MTEYKETENGERPVDRYARQTLFPGIGREGQAKLGQAKVVIIGCGALGTVTANNLVRAGVGQTTIIDRDFIELHNLQRQSLFTEDDIAANLPKAVAAVNHLKRVNREVKIEGIVTDVEATNVERLLSDNDLVLDGTDNFETRYLLNDACVKMGLPWIYGGVIASYGMTMTILPGQTPCLRCLFLEAPPPGVAPTCDTAGVLGPIVNIIASLQSAEALKLLTGNHAQLNPGLASFDVWENTYTNFTGIVRDPECPTCGQHDYKFLDEREGTHTTSLCGRGAVQISVRNATRISFHDLAERLQSVGKVSYNEFMLRFKIDPYELTVFPDARTIVKGTQDEVVARTLYARYVGA